MLRLTSACFLLAVAFLDVLDLEAIDRRRITRMEDLGVVEVTVTKLLEDKMSNAEKISVPPPLARACRT